MIKANVEITADTEEHYLEIVEEVYKNLKKSHQSEAFYIWKDSYHKVTKHIIDESSMTTAELLRKAEEDTKNVRGGRLGYK